MKEMFALPFLPVPTSMPCEEKPRFVLLYGSQKGQAQAIAEGVAEEAETHGLFAELSCLENNEKVTFEIILARVHSSARLHTMGSVQFQQRFQVNYCKYV